MRLAAALQVLCSALLTLKLHATRYRDAAAAEVRGPRRVTMLCGYFRAVYKAPPNCHNQNGTWLVHALYDTVHIKTLSTTLLRVLIRRFSFLGGASVWERVRTLMKATLNNQCNDGRRLCATSFEGNAITLGRHYLGTGPELRCASCSNSSTTAHENYHT